jgi:hypothetical protein
VGELRDTTAVDRQYVSSQRFLGAYSTNQPLIGATGPWYTEGIVGLSAEPRRRHLSQAARGVEPVTKLTRPQLLATGRQIVAARARAFIDVGATISPTSSP